MENLKNSLSKKNIKYCVNTTVVTVNEVKYIVVGDNPGTSEFIENRYFVGKAGKQLRKIFEENDLVVDFDRECKVFNKTIIHTALTNELRSVQESNPVEFEESLKMSAREIAQFANTNELPILVFGKSNLTVLFRIFMEELLLKVIDSKNIFVFSHPSYGHFGKEWKKNRKLNASLSNEDLLLCIGKQNFDLIKKQLKILLSLSAICL